MPNRDGKGPNGEGPRTGRQMGNCDEARPVGRGRRPFFGRRNFAGRRFEDSSEKD